MKRAIEEVLEELDNLKFSVNNLVDASQNKIANIIEKADPVLGLGFKLLNALRHGEEDETILNERRPSEPALIREYVDYLRNCGDRHDTIEVISPLYESDPSMIFKFAKLTPTLEAYILCMKVTDNEDYLEEEELEKLVSEKNIPEGEIHRYATEEDTIAFFNTLIGMNVSSFTKDW